MAQDDMASLVNIAKIKPEERTQTSASFNESNFVGGNIQIGAPSQQIGKTDDQAMFESLAAISSGVEVGISNYMKVAETVDKETVSKVKAQWATIDAQEINPKEKMKQLNEVLAQAKTPFIGYTWREEAHAVASKSWGTPAYEEYIKTDFDTFLLNHPKYTENMGPSLRKAMVSEYLQENPSAEASLYLKKTTGEAEATLSNMAADRMILQVSTSIVLPYDIDQKKQEGLLNGTFSLESLEKEAPAYHAALVKARDSENKEKFFDSFINDTMISLEKGSDGLTEEQYEKLFLQLKARLVPIAQQIYATSEIMQANAEEREVVQSVGILIQDTSEHGIDSANLDPVVNTLWQSMSISDPKAQYATIMGFTNAYYNSINDDTNKDSKGMTLIEKDEHFNITIKAIFQDLINTGAINPASFGVKVLKPEEILRQFKDPTMMTAKRDQLNKQMASAAKTISLASRQGGEQQQLPPQQAFQDIFIKKTGATQAQADKIFPKEVRKKTADGDIVVYTPSSEILEDKAISVLLERLGITKPEELDELREHFSQASILTGSGGGSNSPGDYKSKTPTPHAAIESIVDDPFNAMSIRNYILENPGVLDPNTAIGRGHINVMEVLTSADIGLNYTLREQLKSKILRDMIKTDEQRAASIQASLDREMRRENPHPDDTPPLAWQVKSDKAEIAALNKTIDEAFTKTYGRPVFDVNKPETSLLWSDAEDFFTFEMLMNTEHNNKEFVDETGELTPKAKLSLARLSSLSILAARVPESDGTKEMLVLTRKALSFVKEKQLAQIPPELLHSLVAVLRGFGDSKIDAAMLTSPESNQEDMLLSGMLKWVARQPLATNTNDILERSQQFIYSLQVLNKTILANSSKDTFETHNQQVLSNRNASIDVVTRESINHFISGIMLDNPETNASYENEELWKKQYMSQELKGVKGSSITNMFVAWLGLDNRRFTTGGEISTIDPVEELLSPILSPGGVKPIFLTPGFNGLVKIAGKDEPTAYKNLTLDERSSFLIATAFESNPEAVILAIKLAIVAKQKFPLGSTGVSITTRGSLVEGLITTLIDVNRNKGVLLSETAHGITFNPVKTSLLSLGTGLFDTNSSSSLGFKEVLPISKNGSPSSFTKKVDSPLLLFSMVGPDTENKLEELGGRWEERFNSLMADLGNTESFKNLSAADCFVIGALTGQCNKTNMEWLNNTLKLGLTPAEINSVPSLPTSSLLWYLLDGKEYSGKIEDRLLVFGIGSNAENRDRVSFTTTLNREKLMLEIGGKNKSYMFLEALPMDYKLDLSKFAKPGDTSYEDAVRSVYVLQTIATVARLKSIIKPIAVEATSNTEEEDYEDTVNRDRQ